MTTFKTNVPLWIVFSVSTFIPLWFVRWFGKGESERAFDTLEAVIRYGRTDLIGYPVFFLFFYGIPSLIVGWVLQAICVVINKRVTEKNALG